VVGWHQRV